MKRVNKEENGGLLFNDRKQQAAEPYRLMLCIRLHGDSCFFVARSRIGHDSRDMGLVEPDGDGAGHLHLVGSC